MNTGVRQGDAIFPILFNITVEKTLQKVKYSETGNKINRLDFANYVAIFSQRTEDLEELVRILIEDIKKIKFETK